MRYIIVRTYGNGMYMRAVYPENYKYMSTAFEKCKQLNAKINDDDKWIVMPTFGHDDIELI